ncbi:MAG: hypothetical protein JWN94_1867 [Betaproteobacteria bacterium]|nr:hypothetical protein [Betaproteobacteria bacterium]
MRSRVKGKSRTRVPVALAIAFAMAATVGPCAIVVTGLLPTVDNKVVQERTALPSMTTVHAPHCAKPQPYLAPFNSRSLRNT